MSRLPYMCERELVGGVRRGGITSGDVEGALRRWAGCRTC